MTLKDDQRTLYIHSSAECLHKGLALAKKKKKKKGKGKKITKKLSTFDGARAFVSKKKRKKRNLLNFPEKPTVSRTIAFLFLVERVVGWLERFRE